MSPEESERLATVEAELKAINQRLDRQFGELRQDLNKGLEKLQSQLAEVCTDLRGEFVPSSVFNERGTRFDDDFEQVRRDVALAKETADKAIEKLNSRIDDMNKLALTLLATTVLNILGTVAYVVITHRI